MSTVAVASLSLYSAGGAYLRTSDVVLSPPTRDAAAPGTIPAHNFIFYLLPFSFSKLILCGRPSGVWP